MSKEMTKFNLAVSCTLWLMLLPFFFLLAFVCALIAASPAFVNVMVDCWREYREGWVLAYKHYQHIWKK